MEDNIETFDLTPSETHESSGSQDLPLQEIDDPLAAGMALVARFNEGSTSTVGPAPGNLPSVGVNEPTSAGSRPSVDQAMDAELDSEAENWSGFSHPDYDYKLQSLLDKSRCRKRDLKLLREEKKEYLERNRKLQAEIEQLRAPKLRHTGVTWPSLFDGEVRPGWMTIYATACKEGNASPLVCKIHPDLRLRKPTSEERKKDLLQEDTAVPLRTIPETLKLPADIQFQILKHFFHFKGSVVHAISRLDPDYPEDSAPLGRDGKPSFYHRLHVGRKPGRFAKGIRANVQRLQHVEIVWIGSQFLTHRVNERNKYTSRRTYSLIWLPEAIRLKTLGIYLPESSKDYTRRRHETNGVVRYMQRKSQLHPNFRGFRQLRTLQGLDYVSCLRGLDRADFWDFDRWLETAERKRPVRDWHFVQDVNNAVRRPKEAGDRLRSQLKNLFPLIPSFAPSEEDWAILLDGLEKPDAQGHGSGTSEDAIMVDDSSDDGSDDGSDVGEDDGVLSSRASSIFPQFGQHPLQDNNNFQPDPQVPEVEVDASNDVEMEGGQEMDGDQEMDDDEESDDKIDDDDEGSDDGESDDESTIIPDDRSITGSQFIDLTMDLIEQQPDQEIVSQTTAPTSGSRADSPLFVDDFHPEYSPSPTPLAHRATGSDWEARSQRSSGPGDEESLFIGSEPSYLRRRRSVAGTRIRSSPTASSESRDMQQEDLTDGFLPAENLDEMPSGPHKRELGDGENGGLESVKRARTSES
ncbi:hypothetical protein MKX07_007097 [Trichoderma sp. CBMAI-0711]|nr:hypothetical protein MKX07_007097 [Trichoderma sp. CBMAI-0711]